MSVAQIPSQTKYVGNRDVDPRTVIPENAIINKEIQIPEPLRQAIDAREKEVPNPFGGKDIPKGLYLPVGTFIPESVPKNTVLPKQTILPPGSRILDNTLVPFGSIVKDGTEIKFDDIAETWYDNVASFWNKLKKVVGQSQTASSFKRQIPKGTSIDKDSVIPVGSVILPGTDMDIILQDPLEITPETRIVDPSVLQNLGFEKDSERVFPKGFVLYPLDEAIARTELYTLHSKNIPKYLQLPPGSVIPKFDDGTYAIIPPGTVIPALENGEPAKIPLEYRDTTEKDQDFDKLIGDGSEDFKIAEGTRIPKGAKIPKGCIIPEGGNIPYTIIVYAPIDDDGKIAKIPPNTFVHFSTSLPRYSGTKLKQIPAGTIIPKTGSGERIRIQPTDRIPEELRLKPSGMLKNISIVNGTFIPKTDLQLNIPRGTIITSDIPKSLLTAMQDKPKFLSLEQQSENPTLISCVMLSIRLFLTIYAICILSHQNGFALSDFVMAFLVPEIFLALKLKREPQLFLWTRDIAISLGVTLLVTGLLWHKEFQSLL